MTKYQHREQCCVGVDQKKGGPPRCHERTVPGSIYCSAHRLEQWAKVRLLPYSEVKAQRWTGWR